MIAVIADDFTGAAELAGIGLRYNLKAEISVSAVVNTAADLLLVSTDSRSLAKRDAEKITADTVKGILLLKPELIYKKVDSVLRGHVIDELNVQMQQSNLRRALIVAANPSLGRTISDGKYFIDGKPVNDAGFATDPEFAITDSSVLKMLRPGNTEVKVLKHTDPLPAEGIVIGEAVSVEDITAWADKVDRNWALAGAGDFFTALLKKKYRYRAQPEAALELPHLYVSGTPFEKSRTFISEAKKRRNCVVYLPASMIETGIADEDWLNGLSGILESQNRAIVAIDDTVRKRINVSSSSLRITMAKAVKSIIEKKSIRELFIEGGSTSAAILNEMGIQGLFPVNEISRGVVRMKIKDMHITVKPGSYELPKQIVELYN